MNECRSFSLTRFYKHLLKIIRKVRERDDRIISRRVITGSLSGGAGHLFPCLTEVCAIGLKYFLHGTLDILMLPYRKNEPCSQRGDHRSDECINQPLANQLLKFDGVEKMKCDNDVDCQKNYKSKVIDPKKAVCHQHADHQ